MVQELVGLAVGLLDDPCCIGLSLGTGLVGVTVRCGAGMLNLMGHLDLHSLGVLLGTESDVLCLLLGQVEHLHDPLSERGEIRPVRGRGNMGLGLVELVLELGDLLLQTGDTALRGFKRLV